MVVSEKAEAAASETPKISPPFDEGDIVEPQGFTLYNERINGRLAMAGFVIGLTTEILSKDHVTIAGQVGMILAPVTSILGVVARELAIVSQTGV